MDRKYYVMGGSIIGVILVLLLSVLILGSCTKKNSYSKIEKKLVKAAEKYIENGDATVIEGSQLIVSDTQLTDAGYLKSLDKLKNDNCSASVTIMNNSGVYNYIPNLVCTNYTSSTLRQKIIDDNLTNKEDGLYAVNGEYIFKGKEPKNHLRFAGQDWLIIKIDYSGNIKLINSKRAESLAQWDDKFNENTNNSYGENDYETSSIRRMLADRYKDFSNSVKKHLIPFSACIGARDGLDLTINENIDCAKTVDNEYLSLMNMSDYALASYDKDCTDMLAGSCMNYNYFRNYIEESWTLNVLSDSTFEVILLSGTQLRAVKANESHKYHDVVYISGNELYVEGDGSVDNPYTIK